MRGRILVGVAMALFAVGLGSVPVAADSTKGGSFHCNATVNGGTITANVVVMNNGVCILNGVTVNGNVSTSRNSYFEANGSSISGNITASQSLTIYVWGHSSVGGNVAGYFTNQIFVYDSTVGKSVADAYGAAPGFGHFQVCGSTVSRQVAAGFTGPDILIGDPAAGCGANTVNSQILVTYNQADSEVYVIGNTVTNGDIAVYNNTGVGDKQVTGNNAPNGDIFCLANDAPFNGGPNGTVGDVEGGQCTATTITGIDPDDGF